MKFRDKQIPQGRILNATISQDPSGKYFCSLCCTDVFVDKLPSTGSVIGIDLGLKEFLITSNGAKVDNPKYLSKSLQKLAKLQKDFIHPRMKKAAIVKFKVIITVFNNYSKSYFTKYYLRQSFLFAIFLILTYTWYISFRLLTRL